MVTPKAVAGYAGEWTSKQTMEAISYLMANLAEEEFYQVVRDAAREGDYDLAELAAQLSDD